MRGALVKRWRSWWDWTGRRRYTAKEKPPRFELLVGRPLETVITRSSRSGLNRPPSTGIAVPRIVCCGCDGLNPPGRKSFRPPPTSSSGSAIPSELMMPFLNRSRKVFPHHPSRPSRRSFGVEKIQGVAPRISISITRGEILRLLDVGGGVMMGHGRFPPFPFFPFWFRMRSVRPRFEQGRPSSFTPAGRDQI